MIIINELFFIKNKYDYCGYYNTRLNYFNLNCIIKYLIFSLLFLFIFFFKNIQSKIYNKIKIEINNNFEISEYERNENYSYKAKGIYSIAFFYPEFFYDKKYNYYFKYNISKNYNDKKNILILKNASLSILIKKQIDLAKSHGIYGFAIYYNLEFKVETIFILEKLIHKDYYFPFFLIWNNKELQNKINNSKKDLLKRKKLFYKSLEIFIKTIKKYLIADIYININNKPIISINNPTLFPNIIEALLVLRKKAKENHIGEIFIFFPFRRIDIDIKYINLFDGSYDLSEWDVFEKNKERQTNFYYSGIIYKNIIFNKISKKFLIYRTSILEIINKKYKKRNILKDYSPAKFYLLNKILISWTNTNFNINNRFIFIKSWNNYIEGNYLEPDEKYGYASINSFSKALFNIPYKLNEFDIKYLNDKCYIAIQAHVFYDDLINEIIKFTNNIPVKFDLYITTTSYEKKIRIEEYVKNSSNTNKYDIKIVENKGRDVLPLLNQLKQYVKSYKYFCHIHTKKSYHDFLLGEKWRNYLYQNLLGNKEIISEIISDFERFDKLGFIFPEVYFEIIKKIDNYDHTSFFLHQPNVKYMNLILNKIFPGFKIGDKLLFPSGNMFWAKVKSVYQIFKINLYNLFPKELNQTNGTIMHAIERIWLYLVKLNGYYYKIIFNFH